MCGPGSPKKPGATVEKGGFWKGDKVIADVPPWKIVLDTYTVHAGNTHVTYTRMRAPYVNADNFRFTIYRKSIFTNLGKMLGMQDIDVGYPKFDEDFVIQGTDPVKLCQLFAYERVRALIEAQPTLRLQVKMMRAISARRSHKASTSCCSPSLA
jgi:hypothetical protein